MKKIIRFLSVIYLTFIFSNCGLLNTDQNSNAVQPNFTSLYSQYLKNCGDCHPGRSTASERVPSLDMTTQQKAFDSLNKIVSIDGKTQCNNVKYINSGHPEKSLLVAILDESIRKDFMTATASSCDVIYHPNTAGSQTPSAQVLAALKEWISKGAANN